jgi:hypothetical protein
MRLPGCVHDAAPDRTFRQGAGPGALALAVPVQPLTALAREQADTAREVYLLIVPTGERGGPASVLSASRADPGVPVYQAAADAVAEYLGREAPTPPVLVGVLPTGDRYAAVFGVSIPADWLGRR